MNGLYLIKPTSIASTGAGNSSSISANGSVTFSSCVTFSLNGVFSADYDNYMLVIQGTLSTSATTITYRLRSSGTDDATANAYTMQSLSSSAATVSGSRYTDTQSDFFTVSTTRSGSILYLYGPNLAQPTASRSISAGDQSGARIFDKASTHNLSTSYDGLTLIAPLGTTTGRVAVYGMVK